MKVGVEQVCAEYRASLKLDEGGFLAWLVYLDLGLGLGLAMSGLRMGLPWVYGLGLV